MNECMNVRIYLEQWRSSIRTDRRQIHIPSNCL